MPQLRVLIVDLNNFARYPTTAVGYLSAVLRSRDCDVRVLSPLAYGVPGVTREPHETVWRDLARRANYAFHSTHGPLARVRSSMQQVRNWSARRAFPQVASLFEQEDLKRYDVVLVSTYLMYHSVCEEIGRTCQQAGVPLVVGGSYFASHEVARSWLALPGLTALVRGEVELELVDLLTAVVARASLAGFAGVSVPEGPLGAPRGPLTALDEVPFPDYSDFPWHRYPNRIIPMITGRGCAWGVCSFCSDVTSTAGRTFRSRSPENVLNELQHQSEKHDADLFVFTDLKLNSDADVWHALTSSIREKVPRAEWVGSVHVARSQPNGLDAATLERAHKSGLRRLTTGLESGSQRILDTLKKGTELGATSKFLYASHAAGISNRVTMIHGSPGESAKDVLASAAFLEQHVDVIDRVNLNRFQIMLGPSFLSAYDASPEKFDDIKDVQRLPLIACADHRKTGVDRTYHRATQRLLGAVHRINRRPLPDGARNFDGVM